MVMLANKDQWYEIINDGPYNSTIQGQSLNWMNAIQARWTSVSGGTYTMQYRCVVRKNSGTSTGALSAYNAYSIVGTGASVVQASGTAQNPLSIPYSTIGDNQVAITTGVINGASGTISGGVKLGYYGTTWGRTDLSGSFTLPATQYPDPPTLSATVISDTKVILEYGTTSFHDASGSVGLRYSTTSGGPYTLIDSATTTGQHTYIHTGLTPGATYYYIANSANTTLISWSQEVAVTMVAPAIEPNPKIYGSVNDLTEKTDKFYGSLNGNTKKILKVYGSVNGQTKRIFQFGLLICYIRDRTLSTGREARLIPGGVITTEASGRVIPT